MRCRLCDSIRLVSVLDLGATPPCEKFLSADELDLPEPTFPLHLRVCEDCLLLQIPALITPEETFTEYAYFSSYSDILGAAREDTSSTRPRNASDSVFDSFVVEVASNDGYLLQHAVAQGHTVPGHRAVGQCRSGRTQRGVPTTTAFLGRATGRSRARRASARRSRGCQQCLCAHSRSPWASPDRCADCWPTTAG